MTDEFNIDISIKRELEAQFWGIFKANMGMSINTGYDWSHTSEETMSESTTNTVEAEAPPGIFHQIMKIQDRWIVIDIFQTWVDGWVKNPYK